MTSNLLCLGVCLILGMTVLGRVCVLFSILYSYILYNCVCMILDEDLFDGLYL